MTFFRDRLSLVGLFDQYKNQSGKGIKKGWGSYKIPLEDICTGKRENPYPLSILKKRLIEEGYMQEECAICSWAEHNIVTDIICLTIDFISLFILSSLCYI